MQALSRREETAVMDHARALATAKCSAKVKEFADCAAGRTFSMAWACRSKLRAWEGCMTEFATQEKLDELRLEYINHRSERGKEAVEQLRKERIESYKRQAGIKDEPAPPVKEERWQKTWQ